MNKRKLLPLLAPKSQGDHKHPRTSIYGDLADGAHRDLSRKRQRTQPHDLCDKCSIVDFPQLFTIADKYKIDLLEEAWKTKDVCPLCRLVMETVERAYPHLEFNSSVPWSDVFNKGIEYKIFSYKPHGWRLGDAFRCAIDIGWTSRWSQTSTGGAHKPRCDLNFDLMSFVLTDKKSSSDPGALSGVEVSRCPIPNLVDYGWLRNWLDSCNTGHKHVDKVTEGSSLLTEGFAELKRSGRFRLIDVSTLDLDKQTVIVRSMTEHESPKYFTLSYQWPQSKREQPRKDKANSTTEIPTEWKVDLSGTAKAIQDAVCLLQRIGERYLWVDAICIVQSNQADIAANINKMGEIYHRASATVVATCRDDAGLPGIRKGTRKGEVPVKFSSEGVLMSFLPVRPGLEDLIRRTSWNSRGWIY